MDVFIIYSKCLFNMLAAEADASLAGALKREVSGLRAELAAMRKGMDSLQAEVAGLKQTVFILQSLD